MQGVGRGRGSTLPAWMTQGGVQPPLGQPPGADWRDVEQVATAAVLEQQDQELRVTLAAAAQG